MTSKIRYKERIDSSLSSHAFHTEKHHQIINEESCAKWATIGECPNGHAFAKKIECGKEWCPRCGTDRSWIHNRRIFRWLRKAQQMNGMGYLVIEWPKHSRTRLRTKKALSDMGKRLKADLSSWGIRRALRRWHFFGENGAKRGYNPHLNIIFDGGYIPISKLESLKSFLREALNEPQLIIHYSYRRSVAEMMHTLRYVTRATFRQREWDNILADNLYGFQNSQSWGTWKDDPVWQLDEPEFDLTLASTIAKLERGVCPHCGESLVWYKPVPCLLLDVWEAHSIGEGYYEIPPPDL